MRASSLRVVVASILAVTACDRPERAPAPHVEDAVPGPAFRNVTAPTEYVGDKACEACHVTETAAYRRHAMSSSFHRWTPEVRAETALVRPLYHRATGYHYSVVEEGGHLYQVEQVVGPTGKRLHELKRRIDYVMGSGNVARTYFTEENGRLFQLPLTWYPSHGWDFSPGYELNNARFDRLIPDRCLACHASHPKPVPYLEGKYAEVRPGIGCERCHGPGARHATEREKAKPDSAGDNTIVNPARLPLERRLDVCEQCHVHTAVTVLREGHTAFDFIPSQSLSDHAAFFKVAGGIDIVSHADRLRQSACFLATRATARPLECATCHNPHATVPERQTRNQTCVGCHSLAVLQREVARTSRAAHAATADCVTCHMPKVQERTVPHGTFTDHWIRVAGKEPTGPPVRRSDDRPIEPYYERDRTGPEAPIYQGLGEVIYATQANDPRALAAGAARLDRALENDATRDDALFFLGVAYEQLGNTAASTRALERSVRADSAHPERLRALALAYARGTRAPAAVEELYQRALRLQPALAWVRAEYADFLRALGRRTESEEQYRSAIAEQPSLAVARFNLGTLLLEMGQARRASEELTEAVHRDPSLAEGLSRLLEIRATQTAVVSVRGLPSPLPTLPVRARGARGVQMTYSAATAAPAITFLNVPAGGGVQIFKPNGIPVRSLSSGTGSSVVWNLLDDRSRPIVGGLYRVRVTGRDLSGRPLPPQVLDFGVVRDRDDAR
jgi:predicted CXXCH cytochrome family protein